MDTVSSLTEGLGLSEGLIMLFSFFDKCLFLMNLLFVV